VRSQNETAMKKIGILTLTRQSSLAYASLKRIVETMGYEPICGQAIGSEALFLPLEEIQLVGYDFLGPFFEKAGLSDADSILISSPYTASVFSLPEVIRSLRAVSGAPVVLGGNEASNNYRHLMEYRFIPFVNTLCDVGPDFIVRGAAESALPALLALLDRGILSRPWTSDFIHRLLDIPNLVFWVPDRSAIMATATASPDLSEDAIFSVVQYGEKSAAVTFQRACVWAKQSQGGCLFCAIAAQFGKDFHCAVKTHRFMDPLVHFLKTHPQIQTVDIWDDTFNTDGAWTRGICGALQEVNRRSGRAIAYTCFLRPAGITPDLAHHLKAANIQAVFIGADALTEDLSKRLRRGSAVAELERSFEVLVHAGIRFNLSLQLFSPESTIEDVQKTAALAMRFIKEDKSSVHLHLYTFPIFGSVLHRLLRVRKNLKTIPSPLMRTDADSGFEALPVAYDYRHYDPDVEGLKKKTCTLLKVSASFFVRTYPGNAVDARRLKEVLTQVHDDCLKARRSHPVKSFWYLCVLFFEGRQGGLSRGQVIDLLSRNESASAIPEDLRRSFGDFGYRFTLSRSFDEVMDRLLKNDWVQQSKPDRYTLTSAGTAHLFSTARNVTASPVAVGAYGTLGRRDFWPESNGTPLQRDPDSF